MEGLLTTWSADLRTASSNAVVGGAEVALLNPDSRRDERSALPATTFTLSTALSAKPPKAMSNTKPNPTWLPLGILSSAGLPTNARYLSLVKS